MKNETFEKSRVISFSDAVFSIAVTLLVLEILIPTYKELKTYNTIEILQRRIPSFIGLTVSFLVIVLYWIGHLRIMKFVDKVPTKLLWFNIFMLFYIVLLPFSTAFYVKAFDFIGPFVFYCFNLSAIGLFNFLITNYIIKNNKGKNGLDRTLSKYLKYRSLNVLIVWILTGLVGLKFPYTARFLFLTIFIFEFFLNRWYYKKTKS